LIEFVDTAGDGYQEGDPLVQFVTLTQAWNPFVLVGNSFSSSTTGGAVSLSATVDQTATDFSKVVSALLGINFLALQKQTNSKLAIRAELVAIHKLNAVNQFWRLPVATIIQQFGSGFFTSARVVGTGTTVNIRLTQAIDNSGAGVDTKFWVYFTIDSVGTLNFSNIVLQSTGTVPASTTGVPAATSGTTATLTTGTTGAPACTCCALC
jgi:hypothetical protein